MRRRTVLLIQLIGAALFGMPHAALAQNSSMAQPQLMSTEIAAVFMILLVVAIALGVASFILRRRTEERAALLEDAAATLLALASKSPDAYLVLHQDMRLVVSDRLREWLDLPFAPRRVTELGPGETGGGFAPESFQQLTEALTKAIKGSETRTQLKLSPHNKKRSLAANILRWQDGSNSPAVICWLRDITDVEDVLADNQAGQGNLRGALHAARSLLEYMPQPAWWRDGKTGDIIDVNKAYLDAVEVASVAQVVEDQVELVAKAEAAAQRASALSAQTDGITSSREAKLVVGGERRAYTLMDIPLGRDITGGIALDTTSTLEMEEELARFTESQNEILNMLSSAVAVFGPEQRLVFYNNAFADLANLSAAWLAEKPRHADVLERMRENGRLPEQANFLAWKQRQLNAYTALLEPDVDTWHLPDDTTLRVVTQPHPFGGLLLLFEDVTDRLALERSFNTLITVQRTTLNNLKEAVAVFGVDGKLQLHNQVFENLWNISGDVLSKKPRVAEFTAAISDQFENQDDVEMLPRTVIQSTVARTPGANRAHLKEGRVIDYAAVPLPDGAVLLTCTNVTSAVQIERALRDRANALEAADKMKTEFVTNMSYELRTPLTSIIGFAEILGEQFFGALNQRQSSYAQDILSSSNKLLALIDGILDLAVSDAGKLELTLEMCAISAVLERAQHALAGDAQRKNITLTAKADRSSGEALIDAKRVTKALVAILENAVRWTPQDGTVAITAKGNADTITISVVDTGVGIAPEEQAIVFERFQRGSNVAGGKSAGLGLALAKQFLALHGGDIQLKSDPGKGTTVTVTLPRNSNAAVAAE